MNIHVLKGKEGNTTVNNGVHSDIIIYVYVKDNNSERTHKKKHNDTTQE